MALTTTIRERFLPAGTTLASFNASTDLRTAGTLGNFTTVTGTLYNRPYGPSVSGDSYANGWSADVRGNANYGVMQFSDTATRNFGKAGAWVYFNSYDNDASNKVQVIKLTRSSDNAEIGCLLLDSTGKLYLRSNNQATTVQVDSLVPIRTWVWYDMSWVRAGTNSYKRAVYKKLVGGSISQIYVQSAADTGFESATFNVQFGSRADSATAAANFRLGSPSVCAFTQADFSDATYPSDLVDPPTGAVTWYIRSDGNDNNAGVSGATAWATVGKVVTETSNAGVFGAAAGAAQTVTIAYASSVATVTATGHGLSTGQLVAIVGATPAWLNQAATITVTDANTYTYTVAAVPPGGTGSGTATGTISAYAFANGDTINVDSINGGSPVDFGTSSLNCKSRGTTIKFTGSPTLRRTLPNAGWVLASGCTKTYQLADGADIVGMVIWENEKWLNKPSGTTFAAVTTSMEATPGSFFEDGTNIYLHPFGDTNPNTDGKTYTRSRNRGTTTGDSAVLMNGTDQQVIGDLTYPPTLKGSALARRNDNDPYNAYLVQFGPTNNGDGICRIANITLDYGGKHLTGNTGNKVGGIMCRDSVTYGQGTPYAVTGGQTQDVDFCTTGSGNQYIFTNCTATVNCGLIGSAAGRNNYSAYPTWISHGGGSTYTGGWFNNCNFCAGFSEQGVTTGTIYVTGGTSAGNGFGVQSSMTVSQHKSTGDPFSLQGSSKTLTLINSIMVVTTTVTNVYFSQLTGTLLAYGLTIDLRGNASTTGSVRSVWSKLTSAAATLQNIVLLVDNAKDFVLLSGFANTDTLNLDHNAYQLGSANKIVGSYNDGSTTADRTLTTWQGYGKDSGSLSAASICDTNQTPPVGSIARAMGNMPSALIGTRDVRGAARPSQTASADAGGVQATGTVFALQIGAGPNVLALAYA